MVYDHRVHARLLRLARPGAERIDVGAAAPKPLEQDAICFLLAEKAREGRTVVRLKWGDPFVFDSGGKEALFLHEQGIPFEVVPGIPAAIGGTAYAGRAHHLSGRGRRADVRARPRGRRTRRRRRLVEARRLGGTLVCYAGARQVGVDRGSLLATAARPTKRRRSSTTARCRRSRRSQGTLGRPSPRTRGTARRRARRRRRRRAARAPALVRRAAALRQAHRRHAIARAGRRAHRDARGARRRGDQGAVDPHRAARDYRRARARVQRRRRFDWIVFTSGNGVDHFMRRLLARATSAT